jgi:hypothetical protein
MAGVERRFSIPEAVHQWSVSADRAGSEERLRIRDHWDDRLVGLESVLLGERNLGQQTLEIAIFGYTTPQEAEVALRRQMDSLIRI